MLPSSFYPSHLCVSNLSLCLCLSSGHCVRSPSRLLCRQVLEVHEQHCFQEEFVWVNIEQPHTALHSQNEPCGKNRECKCQLLRVSFTAELWQNNHRRGRDCLIRCFSVLCERTPLVWCMISFSYMERIHRNTAVKIVSFFIFYYEFATNASQSRHL